MAIELAAAYVTIIPSLKGATRQITSQLAGVDTSVGSKLGEQLSDKVSKGFNVAPIAAKFESVGSSISGVGAKLTSGITKPVGLAATAVGGLVTVLGFKRLIGIDTARGQFKGLGHDADAVMAQVDKGVTNTALSMAEGASLAVGILATGNLPLEQLEGQLKRVANVSAAYGVDASQAGYLLNNVLTKNKVTYGDLSQMVQNQIPIISMLADHYGVTGDEIQKMAQDGEISIEDFNKVLDSNAGAAAEEYAKTWKGVTSNIMSNIGRMGAQILDSVFPQMKEQLGGFLELLKSDDAKAFAADVGVFLGDAFTTLTEALKTAITWWNGLSPAAQKTIGIFAGVAVAAGPVLKIVGSITSGVGKLVTGFGKTVDVAASMGRGIKSGFETAHIASMYAMDGVKAFGSNVKIAAMLAKDSAVSFGLQAKSIVVSSAAWVKNTAVMVAQKTALVASTVATKAAAVAQRAFNLVMNANPIGLIITAIAALVAGLVWFFTQTELGQTIWANFTQFLTEAWTNIVNVGKTVWEGLASFFTGLWDGIKLIFTNVVNWVTDMFMAWHPLGIIISNWDAITAFFGSFWDGVKAFFASALQFVVDLFMNWTVYGLIITHWDEIKAFFGTLWAGIKAVFSAAVSAISSAVTGFLSGVKSVWTSSWSAISGFFSSIWRSIVSAASGFFNSVKSKFTSVTNFISQIPAKVLGFFTGIGSTLIDSGKALIQGFLDGITAGFDNAKKFVSDGLGKIRDLFPFSPAKDGPFSGQGWVLYSGLSLGETFTGAIADSLSDGRSEVADELDGIADEFQRIEDYANGTEFSVRSAVPDVGDGTRGRGAGVAVTNNIDARGQDPRILEKHIGRKVEGALFG